MSKRRYNEQEIGAILQRAGEIQGGVGAETDQAGLTMEELQRVALEVGIQPQALAEAALEVESRESGISRVLDHTVDGVITDEQWEDIVIRLRQYAGKAGTSTVQGSSREWTADWEMGSMTLTASTRNNQTRIRLLGDSTGAGAMAYVFGGILGFLATIMSCAWVGKAGLGALAVIGTLLFVSTLCFFLTRIWARKWTKKSRGDVAKLFADIIAKADSAPLPASTPTVVTEDTVQQQRA